MTRSHRLLPLLLALAVLVPAFASASPQQKLMAKRAAELDAYRLLAERVLGLEITSGSTVADFVGESDNIATALDATIKGVRFSDVRHFSDGSCEVDAALTLKQVVTTLEKAHDAEYDGGHWNKSDFEKITTKSTRTVIEVTGSGAARAQSEIADPAGQPIIGPIVGTRRNVRTQLPGIYRDFPPAERLKAKRAAELDAYRKMLERIYGLDIEAGTEVRDFVTESDIIRTRTEGTLKGVRFDNVRYAPDGVVEVEASLSVRQVVTMLEKIYDETYRGGKWEKSDFEKITKKSVTKTLTVIGTGALDTAGGSSRDRGDRGDREVEIEVEISDQIIVVE